MNDVLSRESVGVRGEGGIARVERFLKSFKGIFSTGLKNLVRYLTDLGLTCSDDLQ